MLILSARSSLAMGTVHLPQNGEGPCSKQGLTFSISEYTDVVHFKFSHNVWILFLIVVSNFQPFLTISLKRVAILVNIDFTILFDIFSLITRKPLGFLETFLFHVKQRWKLVENHHTEVCNFEYLFMKSAFLRRALWFFYVFQHFFANNLKTFSFFENLFISGERTLKVGLE